MGENSRQSDARDDKDGRDKVPKVDRPRRVVLGERVGREAAADEVGQRRKDKYERCGHKYEPSQRLSLGGQAGPELGRTCEQRQPAVPLSSGISGPL